MVINAAGDTLTASGHQIHSSIGQAGSGYFATARYSLQAGFLNDYSTPSAVLTPAVTPTRTFTPVPEAFFKVFSSNINPNRGEQARLRWTQPQDGPATIKIFNLLGDKVTTLVNQENCSKGQFHETRWRGDTQRGTTAGSGIYIAVLEAPGYKARVKIAVVK